MAMMKNKRVVVGMSGGVDSSVAAALLNKQGYEVIGITMRLGRSLRGIKDARRVAHKLGIRHYVLDMRKSLEEQVIGYFCQEYACGRTPNPCVVCNQSLKFGELLKKALSFGAAFLATGHYARIAKTPRGLLIRKAKDLKKDQSYFLYRLNQGQLRHIIFPLGNYTKEEVRGLARRFGLAVAEKKGSQEICFLPGDDYRAFLRARINKGIRPGLVLDSQGHIAGKHKGIAYYTIGQREGLGIARGYPVYITKIDASTGTICIGPRAEAVKQEALLKDLHFSLKPIKKRVALKVKIRYNHKEAEAKFIPSGNKAKIIFKKPQFAITPGQSAVFYEKDRVLGGAIIDEVIR